MRISRPRFPARVLLGAVVLVAATFGVYRPVLTAGAGYIWDDDQYLVDNRLLDEEGGLLRIWTEPTASPQYYPLVFTSYLVDRALFGRGPLGHHAVNVFLQALCALLLWALGRRLDLPAPWFGAAIFALHPLQVESVAWITERKNLLSMALALGATLAWLRFRMPIDSASERSRAWGAYAAALFLFALALTAKTVVSVLPAVWLLILWGRRGLGRRDLLQCLPFLYLGIRQGLLTARLEREHVGAQGPEWDLDLVERVLVAGRGLLFYVGRFLAPLDLSFNYPRVLPEATDPGAWLALLAAGMLLLIPLASMRRLGRSAFVFAAGFAGTTFPALGFFDVFPFRYSFVADHFVYHALAFPALATGALIGGRRRGPGRVVVAVLVLGLLGGLATQRAEVFRDRESLWRDTLDVHPGSGLALHNLGILRLEAGDLVEARTLLERARATGLDRDRVLRHLALVHGMAGRPEEALACAEGAVALAPDDPANSVAVAVALLDLGRPRAALRRLDEALALDDEAAFAHEKRAAALFNLGRFAEARDAARRATRLAPRAAGAWNTLGLLESRSGDRAAAREAFARACALSPEQMDFRLNLAQAELAIGDAQAALVAVSRVLHAEPTRDAARLLHGRALWALRPEDPPEALLELVESRERVGTRRAARRVLVRGLLAAGDHGAALAVVRRVAPESEAEAERERRQLEARVLLRAGRQEEARRIFEATLGPRGAAAIGESGMEAALRAFCGEPEESNR